VKAYLSLMQDTKSPFFPQLDVAQIHEKFRILTEIILLCLLFHPTVSSIWACQKGRDTSTVQKQHCCLSNPIPEVPETVYCFLT